MLNLNLKVEAFNWYESFWVWYFCEVSCYTVSFTNNHGNDIEKIGQKKKEIKIITIWKKYIKLYICNSCTKMI